MTSSQKSIFRFKSLLFARRRPSASLGDEEDGDDDDDDALDFADDDDDEEEYEDDEVDEIGRLVNANDFFRQASSIILQFQSFILGYG